MVEYSQEDNEEKDIENMEQEEQPTPKPQNLKQGLDIAEGRTVFDRSLSYEIEEEILRDLMEEILWCLPSWGWTR